MKRPCTPHHLQLIKTSSSLFTPVAGAKQFTFIELVISFVDSLLRQGLPSQLESNEQYFMDKGNASVRS